MILQIECITNQSKKLWLTDGKPYTSVVRYFRCILRVQVSFQVAGMLLQSEVRYQFRVHQNKLTRYLQRVFNIMTLSVIKWLPCREKVCYQSFSRILLCACDAAFTGPAGGNSQCHHGIVYFLCWYPCSSDVEHVTDLFEKLPTMYTIGMKSLIAAMKIAG